MLSDTFRKIETPWSTVGYLTYKRTYSRRKIESDLEGPTEEWDDTIKRVIEACNTQLKVGFEPEEAEELAGFMKSLKGTVAGRFLWQLGTSTVDKLGLPSLQNCAAVLVNSPVRPFTWAMDRLMLGVGVGFNIQKEYVFKLPKVKANFELPERHDFSDADHIVPDTREGWVKLLELTLQSAFYGHTKSGFRYSTQMIRGKGAPIKGFGGVASGPEDLCWGIEQISKVILARVGKQLRPIDCLDIMNIIGAVVVAGNVRRSAQIAIGDADDLQFLNAKNWSEGNIPNWRSNSNNSVVCNDFKNLPAEFWKTYEGNSEPYGLINLKLSRNVGRIGDSQYKDLDIVCYNPCAEQGLEDHETCCLAETFLPNINSKKELFRVTRALYRVCKHSLALHDAASPETQEVVNRNMRMGIGITGYLQATKEQRSWLADTYTRLREYDVEYSKLHGWNVSIKLTTCKPSGTLSLLPGVTSGVHPAYSQYMIRRIRIASNHALVNVCRDHGYTVEFVRRFDGTDDRSTVVVEFPYSYPEGTVIASQMSAIEQLEVVRTLQTDWSDNSVSCTVYYRREELEEIQEYLAKKFNKNFKSLSFLLHTGHGFDQAPFEEISKEDYEILKSRTKLITSIAEASIGLDDGAECSGGVCPVR